MSSANNLVRGLSDAWERVNNSLFGSALRPPVFRVTPQLHRALAQWVPSKRAIEFSRDFVSTAPWWTVLEVLKHEMAHQYVSEILGIEDEESAHGAAFRMVCDRYGIDRSAGRAFTDDEKRIVEKVRLLLQLSTSPNRHEAEAALAKAHELLGRYDLDEERVREGDANEYGVLCVGDIIVRPARHHDAAASILVSHFRVRAVWGHDHDPRRGALIGVRLEIAGCRGDLAMAEYVHGWLHGSAERLCPHDLPKRAREDFLFGVMHGYGERLDNAVDQIVSLLDRGIRMVALRGAPGSGKTQVLRQLASLRHGFYVELGDHPDAETGLREALSVVVESFGEPACADRSLPAICAAVRRLIYGVSVDPLLVLDAPGDVASLPMGHGRRTGGADPRQDGRGERASIEHP
jgi:hypothetical protein